MTRREITMIAEEVVSIMESKGYVDDKVLTAKQAAEYLGISVSALYKIKSDLPHIKIDRKSYGFFRSDLNKYLRR